MTSALLVPLGFYLDCFLTSVGGECGRASWKEVKDH